MFCGFKLTDYGIEKSKMKDFRFFLEQKNFLKVVDTLEKFETVIID